MIRMEAAGQQQPTTVTQCWIPNNTHDTGVRDTKPNIQIQYAPVPSVQNMYNAPCSIYNTPVITLPPSSQTYIIDTNQQPSQQIFQQQPQTPQQQPQPPQQQQQQQQQSTTNKQTGILRCSHFPTCKFYTENSQSLKNHELLHFSSQNLAVYHCNDCNITFGTKAAKNDHDRRKHRSWPKVYSCSYCNFETQVLDEFSEHNVQYHLETGTSGQIYQCHQCNYSTSWKCFMDSHMLIHNINELDYNRSSKKLKYEFNSTSSNTSTTNNNSNNNNTNTCNNNVRGVLSSVNQKSVSVGGVIGGPAVITTTPSSISSTVSGQKQQQQQHQIKPVVTITAASPTAKHIITTLSQHVSNINTPNIAPKPARVQQGANIVMVSQQKPLQSTNFYHSIPQSTLPNIAPMPPNTILTTLHPVTTAATNNHTVSNSSNNNNTTNSSNNNNPPNYNSGVKQEYRCNLCHHFITTCSTTLHEHIKSHNTCQQCGYQTNDITDLSLHVCPSYETQQPSYAPALIAEPWNNFSQVNTPASYSAAGVPPSSGVVKPPSTTVSTGGGISNTSRKRSNRQHMDDDFEQNLYRCRQCDYSTSWKCFLDSHMLTHVGI